MKGSTAFSVDTIPIPLFLYKNHDYINQKHINEALGCLENALIKFNSKNDIIDHLEEFEQILSTKGKLI